MRALPTEVLDHLESHHGIISNRQLRQLGVSGEMIRSLVRGGLLEEVLQGAYRVRGQPLSDTGRHIAVCVAHPSCAIAGLSAGRHHQLRRVPVEARVADRGELVRPVHVLAPPRSQPTVKRWVTPYRTAAIHWDEDVIEFPDGLRLTTPARTVVDLARFVNDLDLLSIVEQTLQRKLATVDALRSAAVDWRSPRRRWIDRLLRLLDRPLAGEPAESHHETVLGDALRAAGVPDLVRQLPVELPGYGAARFDLAVPSLRWAIEVDVFPTHFETEGRRRDQQRDAASAGAGWIISRVGPDGFGAALPSTVDRLVAIFNELRPSIA